MVKKVKLSWEDIQEKVNVLADKFKDCKFDAVISIGRGGMVPARLLAEKLDIHTAYVIDAKAYTSDDKLGQLHVDDVYISNDIHSVLVIDDVIFTGTTLDAVMVKLAGHENITEITNAFLYKNDKTTYDGSPYVYAQLYDGNSEWLVFPWENS